jgi:hypothetical protein
MKKVAILTVLFAVLFLPELITAQDSERNVRFFGFVKYDFFYDSREMVAARQGQYSLYPAAKSFNQNGNDVNGNPNFHMLAIQTRLGLDMKGPDAFGATSRGFIEGAFFGNIESDINGFRLRHAFVELNWDGRHKLMMGQFWHPMFAERAVPGVVGFNTGAPYKPFARNPQLRYTLTEGNTSFILAALSQIDFVSQFGSHSIRRSGVPNLHAQVQQQFGSLLTGLGADYKMLRPTYNHSEETISSYAFTGFGNYGKGNFRLMFQGTYGQNLFDHLMLGGFGANTTNSGYELENITIGAAWFDVSYGTKTKAGLFGGYSKNFGADSDFTQGAVAYRGGNIDHIWRISPRIEWTSGPVRLSTEIEISSAAYGTPNSKGVVENTSSVQNYRLLLAAWYSF